MNKAAIKKIELDANLIRAAIPFKGKNDPRYYLNGIHLDPKGFICATNGHVMFRAKCPEAKDLAEEMIIDIKGSIPAKAQKATVTLIEGETSGIIEFHKKVARGTKPEYRAFEIIAGKFPDTERVVPTGELQATPIFGINPAYMALVDKATKALGSRYSSCVFQLRGKNNPLEVSIDTGTYKATVIIMPVNIDRHESNKSAA